MLFTWTDCTGIMGDSSGITSGIRRDYGNGERVRITIYSGGLSISWARPGTWGEFTWELLLLLLLLLFNGSGNFATNYHLLLKSIFRARPGISASRLYTMDYSQYIFLKNPLILEYVPRDLNRKSVVQSKFW